MKKHVTFPTSLYTRISIIDQQHKDLIDAVNKLYDAINEGKGVDEAKKALAFLSQYVIFHLDNKSGLLCKMFLFYLSTQMSASLDFVSTVYFTINPHSVPI